MPGPLRLLLLLALAFAALSQPAYAGNTPCSGSKGGIARCDDDLFLCNDGSISGSKRSCPVCFVTSNSSHHQVDTDPHQLINSSRAYVRGISTFGTPNYVVATAFDGAMQRGETNAMFGQPLATRVQNNKSIHSPKKFSAEKRATLRLIYYLLIHATTSNLYLHPNIYAKANITLSSPP